MKTPQAIPAAAGGIKRKKEIVLVLNVSNAVVDTMCESTQLGLGEPLLISSGHGDGNPHMYIFAHAYMNMIHAN
jgi:hypothetical protein